ncbi:MAG: hypothetical protein LBU12_05855 [Deltaproteobacteria bacterium]|nr:hypothetical protein [Deltaproteobacteria bacterium]
MPRAAAGWPSAEASKKKILDEAVNYIRNRPKSKGRERSRPPPPGRADGDLRPRQNRLKELAKAREQARGTTVRGKDGSNAAGALNRNRKNDFYNYKLNTLNEFIFINMLLYAKHKDFLILL